MYGVKSVCEIVEKVCESVPNMNNRDKQRVANLMRSVYVKSKIMEFAKSKDGTWFTSAECAEAMFNNVDDKTRLVTKDDWYGNPNEFKTMGDYYVRDDESLYFDPTYVGGMMTRMDGIEKKRVKIKTNAEVEVEGIKFVLPITAEKNIWRLRQPKKNKKRG